jgi:uncharacterized protein
MHDNISYSLVFLLGISSSFHCIGMCGGIISALSLSLPAQARSQPIRLFSLVCGYNLGRIASYSLAGGIVGYIAYLSPLSSASNTAYVIMQCLASAFLVALGLHIAGWFPQMKLIEALGLHVWRHIQPLGKRFIPVESMPSAIMLGMVWGWLPCGLVYSVLLWTISSVDPVKGAIYMFIFGLGTLPSMLSTALASNAIMKISKMAKYRLLAGVLIIILGLASPFLQLSMLEKSGDAPHSMEHSHH